MKTLKTEQNTFEMAKKIVVAANKHFKTRSMKAVFEHGQWWVYNTNSYAQYSVVDAEGPGTTNGFDFEMVTAGEEE
jgi:hypothetical protein